MISLEVNVANTLRADVVRRVRGGRKNKQLPFSGSCRSNHHKPDCSRTLCIIAHNTMWHSRRCVHDIVKIIYYDHVVPQKR